jgi:hypothetical protein
VNVLLYGSFAVTLLGVACVFRCLSRVGREFSREVVKDQLSLDSLEVLHRGRDLSVMAPEHLVSFRRGQYQTDLLREMERLNLADPLAALGFWVWMHGRAAIGRQDNQFVWQFKRFVLAGRDVGAPEVCLGHFQRAHFAYILERFYHAQPGYALNCLSDFRAHNLTVTDFNHNQNTWFLNLKFRMAEDSLLPDSHSDPDRHSSLSVFIQTKCLVVNEGTPRIQMAEFHRHYADFCQANGFEFTHPDIRTLRLFGFEFANLSFNGIAVDNWPASPANFNDSSLHFFMPRTTLPTPDPHTGKLGLLIPGGQKFGKVEPIWPVSLRPAPLQPFVAEGPRSLGSASFPDLSLKLAIFGFMICHGVYYLCYKPFLGLLDVCFTASSLRNSFRYKDIDFPYRAHQAMEVRNADPSLLDRDYLNVFLAFLVVTLGLPPLLFGRLLFHQWSFTGSFQLWMSTFCQLTVALFNGLRAMCLVVGIAVLSASVLVGGFFSFVAACFDFAFFSNLCNYVLLSGVTLYYLLVRLPRTRARMCENIVKDVDGIVQVARQNAELRHQEKQRRLRLELLASSQVTLDVANFKIQELRNLTKSWRTEWGVFQNDEDLRIQKVNVRPTVKQLRQILHGAAPPHALVDQFMEVLIDFSWRNFQTGKGGTFKIVRAFLRLLAFLEISDCPLRAHQLGEYLSVLYNYFEDLRELGPSAAGPQLTSLLTIHFGRTHPTLGPLIESFSVLMHELSDHWTFESWDNTVKKFLDRVFAAVQGFNRSSLMDRFVDSLLALRPPRLHDQLIGSRASTTAFRLSNAYQFVTAWLQHSGEIQEWSSLLQFLEPSMAPNLFNQRDQTFMNLKTRLEIGTLSAGHMAVVSKLWALARGLTPEYFLSSFVDVDLRNRIKAFLGFGLTKAETIVGLLSKEIAQNTDKLLTELLTQLGCADPHSSYRLLKACFQLHPKALLHLVQRQRPKLLQLMENLFATKVPNLPRLYQLYDKHDTAMVGLVNRVSSWLTTQGLSVTEWRRALCQLGIRHQKGLSEFMGLVIAGDLIKRGRQLTRLPMILRVLDSELEVTPNKGRLQPELKSFARALGQIRAVAVLDTSVPDKLRLARRSFFELGLRVKRLEDLLRCVCRPHAQPTSLARNFRFFDLGMTQLHFLADLVNENFPRYGQAISLKFPSQSKTDIFARNLAEDLLRRLYEARNGEFVQSPKSIQHFSRVVEQLPKDKLPTSNLEGLNHANTMQIMYLEKREVRRKAEYIVSRLAEVAPGDILPFYRIYLFYGMLYARNPGLDELMNQEIINRVTGRYEMLMTIQENYDPNPLFLATLLDGCKQTAWDQRFLNLNQKLDEGLARVYTFPVVQAVQRLVKGEDLDDAFLVGIFGDARLARLLRWAMALKRDRSDSAAILDLADERHFLNRHRFRVSEMKLLWGIHERKVNLKEAWALLKHVVPPHLLEVLLTVLAFDNQLPTDALFDVYPHLLLSSEFFNSIGIDSLWSWVALLYQKGEFKLAKSLLGPSGSYSRLNDSHTMESLVTDLVEVRQAAAILRRNEYLLRPILDRRQLGARELVATFSPGLPRPLQYNPSLFLMLHCGDSHAEAVSGKVWRHGFARAESFLFFYLYLNLRNYRAFKLEFLFDLLFFRSINAYVEVRRRSDSSFAVPRDMLASFDAKLAQLTAVFNQMFRHDRLFVPYRRLRERLSVAEQLILSCFLDQARSNDHNLMLKSEEEVVNILVNRELLARWRAWVEEPDVHSILDTVFRSHDLSLPLTHYFFERPTPRADAATAGPAPVPGGFPDRPPQHLHRDRPQPRPCCRPPRSPLSLRRSGRLRLAALPQAGPPRAPAQRQGLEPRPQDPPAHLDPLRRHRQGPLLRAGHHLSPKVPLPNDVPPVHGHLPL